MRASEPVNGSVAPMTTSVAVVAAPLLASVEPPCCLQPARELQTNNANSAGERIAILRGARSDDGGEHLPAAVAVKHGSRFFRRSEEHVPMNEDRVLPLRAHVRRDLRGRSDGRDPAV